MLYVYVLILGGCYFASYAHIILFIKRIAITLRGTVEKSTYRLGLRPTSVRLRCPVLALPVCPLSSGLRSPALVGFIPARALSGSSAAAERGEPETVRSCETAGHRRAFFETPRFSRLLLEICL